MISQGTKKILLYALVSLLACTAPSCHRTACVEKRPPSDVHPAAFPLAAFSSSKGRLVVYPARSVSWRQLVSLEIFKGLSPGMTLREAKGALGEPSEVGEDYFGKYWRFRSPYGIIEIRHEEQGALFLYIPKSWTLRGFPYDHSAARLLHPSILSLLSSRRLNPETLVVVNNCGYPGVRLYFKDGQVDSVQWVSGPGSR